MAKIKGETLMAVLAGIAILYMIYNYSRTKTISGFMQSKLQGSELSGAEPVGAFASNQGSVQRSSGPETVASLLPADPNAGWQNQSGQDPFQAMMNINTTDLIGQARIPKRNMNLQLRCDPTIAIVPTGPFNNSTIQQQPQMNCLELGAEGKL
jgi:hypothetical protein